MKKIFENKSLRFICNSINIGLVETDEIQLNKLQIISKNKPGFFVKPIDIDLKDFIYDMMKTSVLSKENINQLETSFLDFVVFNTITDNSGVKTLLIISLNELLLIAPKILINENQQREESESNTNDFWSLDTEEWDLIYIN